jgi:hypothetical protein
MLFFVGCFSAHDKEVFANDFFVESSLSSDVLDKAFVQKILCGVACTHIYPMVTRRREYPFPFPKSKPVHTIWNTLSHSIRVYSYR